MTDSVDSHDTTESVINKGDQDATKKQQIIKTK